MGFRSSLKNQKKATRIFTDREEPRAAFWKKYNQTVRDMRSDTEDPAVLTYYGVGGIGKSSLLKQLIKEMEQKPRPPKYIYFDFTNVQDSYSIMKSLRNKLVKEHGFNFRLFDAGCYLYATAIGQDAAAPEAKQLTEKHKALSIAMTVLSEVPGLSLVSKVFSYADKAGAMIQTYRMNHQSEMEDREDTDPVQMLRQLTLLFSMDLNRQMQNAEEPLVILLDTYEKLRNDQWLHSTALHPDCKNSDEPFCEGIIPNVPHTLWVIAGREKLKWAEYTPEWNAALSQHILGDLSQSDSDYFLKNAGVEPELLRAQLYELTHGTPVYLDLCVEQYYACQTNGITPTIADFGSTPRALVERFALYMDDNQKIVVYILACLQSWSDELLLSFAPRALPSYNPETYDKKIKHLSFIIESDDDQYNIHQTVGEVLLQDCPKVIRRQIAQTMVDFFSEQLSDLPLGSDDFILALNYLLRAGILLQESREDLRVFFKETLQPYMRRLEDNGYWTSAEDLLDKLEDICCENRLDGLYAQWLKEKAWLMYKQGSFLNIFTAYELAAQSVILHTVLFGPKHLDTLQALRVMSAILVWQSNSTEVIKIGIVVREEYDFLFGDSHLETLDAQRDLLHILIDSYSDNAVPLAQEILEKQQKYLPPEDLSIPQAMTDLARAYNKDGRRTDALALYRQCLAHLLQYHGEQSTDTNQAKMALADELAKGPAYKEAFALYRQVLEFRQNRFGNMHPDTISVMLTLARRLEWQGQYEQALPLWQQLAEIKNTLPDSLRDTVSFGSPEASLFNIFRVLGRMEEAEKIAATTRLPYTTSIPSIYRAGSPELNRIKQEVKEGKKTYHIYTNRKERVCPETWSAFSDLHYFSQRLFQVRKEYGEDQQTLFDCSRRLVLLLCANGFYTLAQDLAHDLSQRYRLNNEQCPVSEESIDLLREAINCVVVCSQARPLTERDCYHDVIALLEPYLQYFRNADTFLPLVCVVPVYKMLIIAYQETEQYEKSLPLKEEFWEICKVTYGDDSGEALTVMQDLIYDYQDFGQPEKAQQLKEELDAKSLSLPKNRLPAKRPETARRLVCVESPDQQKTACPPLVLPLRRPPKKSPTGIILP